MKYLALFFLAVCPPCLGGGAGGCYSPYVVSQYYDQLANGTDDCGSNNLTSNGSPVFLQSNPYVFFGFNAAGPFTDANYWSQNGGLVTTMKANRNNYSFDDLFYVTNYNNGTLNQVLFSFDGANFTIFGFTGGAGNNIRFYANGTESAGSTACATNTWYHVTWSWDGTTRRVWVAVAGRRENAETLNNSTVNGALDASVANMFVGRWTNATSYYLLGYQNHLRFWKTALTQPPRIDLATLKSLPVNRLKTKLKLRR